jgi:hypothetical protein
MRGHSQILNKIFSLAGEMIIISPAFLFDKLFAKCYIFFMNKYVKIVLILFFIFFLTLAFLFCLDNSFLINSIDLLFSIDSRLSLFFDTKIHLDFFLRHSSCVLFIYPILNFIKLFSSMNMSILILQSFIAVCSMIFIFLGLDNLIKNKLLALLCLIIYGVSFSTLIVTIMPETYIFSGFLNSLLFYYYTILCKKNNIYFRDYFGITLCGVINTGINFVNIIPSLLFLFDLIIRKNNKFTIILKKCFSYCLFFIFLLGSFFLIQVLRYEINLSYMPSSINKIRLSFDYHFFKLENAEKIFDGLYIESIYPLNYTFLPSKYSSEKDFQYRFSEKQNFNQKIPALVLFVFCLFSFIINFKVIDKKRMIFLLLLILLLNFISTCFFTFSYESFLFSQNILPYFIILIGVLLSGFVNKIIPYIFLIAFIIYEIFINFIEIHNIYNEIMLFYQASSFGLLHYFYLALSISLILILGYVLVCKKFDLKKIKHMSEDILLYRCLVIYTVIAILVAIYKIIF